MCRRCSSGWASSGGRFSPLPLARRVHFALSGDIGRPAGTAGWRGSGGARPASAAVLLHRGTTR